MPTTSKKYPIDLTLTQQESQSYPTPPDVENEDGIYDRPFDNTTLDFEGISTQNQRVTRFNLTTIGNWPETKTEWKTKCAVVFGRRICTDIPKIYKRQCKKTAFVKVRHPTLTGAKKDVEDCINSSALVAAAAAVISKGSAASAVFELALIECLKAKGASWASSVRVAAGHDSKCGRWKAA